jgi:hypothetical protein
MADAAALRRGVAALVRAIQRRGAGAGARGHRVPV